MKKCNKNLQLKKNPFRTTCMMAPQTHSRRGGSQAKL